MQLLKLEVIVVSTDACRYGIGRHGNVGPVSHVAASVFGPERPETCAGARSRRTQLEPGRSFFVALPTDSRLPPNSGGGTHGVTGGNGSEKIS